MSDVRAAREALVIRILEGDGKSSLFERQAAFADRLQVLPARDDAHALTGFRELGRQQAADRSSSDYANVHRCSLDRRADAATARS